MTVRTRHPLYTTWSKMLARCKSNTATRYSRYGGRGITICTEWLDFDNFVRDMGAKPDPTYTVERDNNDLGYCPSNCVCGSKTKQSHNRGMMGNNTTGAPGVVRQDGRFSARFNYEKRRYEIGRFDDVASAAAARATFIELFFLDKESAVSSVSDRRKKCFTPEGFDDVP